MKRSTLSALGLEKEVINTIMQEHGETIEILKERYNEQTEDLKNKLKIAQDTLKEFQANNDGKDYKALYEAELATREELDAKLKSAEETLAAEKEAHKKTVDWYNAEKESAILDNKLAEALKTAGMNEAAIPKALKLYDREIVKLDKDGAIENTDKVIEHFKGEWGAFFGEEKEQGVNVGTPPTNTAGTKDYKALLETARKEGKTQDAVRIKTEAAKDGVFLI